MTKRTKMKMTAFFHRLIYVVLGVEAVIIMVYMMMSLTSCSEDNDVDTPTADIMEALGSYIGSFDLMVKVTESAE